VKAFLLRFGLIMCASLDRFHFLLCLFMLHVAEKVLMMTSKLAASKQRNLHRKPQQTARSCVMQVAIAA